jgi:hypothetical protein
MTAKTRAPLDRRLAVREKHIALGDEMVAQGKSLFGAAILDDSGSMIGSMRVVDFSSKAELEEWLKKEEPYVYGDVWKELNVVPCRVGPSYEEFLPPKPLMHRAAIR